MNSFFQNRRGGFAFIVRKYDNPEINQIDKRIKAVIKDCKDKNFHTSSTHVNTI